MKELNLEKAKWLADKIRMVSQEADTMFDPNRPKMQGGGMLGKSYWPAMSKPYDPNQSFPNGDFAYTPPVNPNPDFSQINFKPAVNNVPPIGEPNLGMNNPAVYNPMDNPMYRIEQDNAIMESNQSVQADNNQNPNNVLNRQEWDRINIFNPYGGVDLATSAYMFGNYLGEGNTGGSILTGSKLGLGLARNVLSGVGFGKANTRAYDDYRNRLLDESNNYQYLQKGGTVADLMTGNFIAEGQSTGNIEAEIEQGEYIKTPNGQVMEAIGEKHSNGGVEVSLEGGTQVISDHTKVGKENAKYFKDKLDVPVKAKDTFATVLDKYSKKIGLTDAIEEEKEVMLSLEKQIQMSNPDTQTQDLNIQFLSGKMQELQDKKKALEEQQKAAYNEIFERQEGAKPKEEKTDQMKNGGIINDLAKQYNISPERVQELMKGGKIMYQGGGRIPNRLENPALYTKQTANDADWNTFGQLPQDQRQVLAAIRERHPDLYQTYFPNDTINKDNIGEFQLALNDKYDNILKDAEVLYADNPDALNQLRSQIAQDRFILDDPQSVRYTDAKFGNYTATRPNYALPLIPPPDLRRLNAEGIFDLNDLRTKRPDEYKRFVGDRPLTSNAWLGEITPAAVDPTIPAEPVEQVVNTQYGTLNTVALLPDQSPLPPPPLDPVLKGNVRFERIDPVKVSIEPNLIEADRQRQATTDALQFLPDGARAAAISNILQQTQGVTNQAISAAEAQNAQNRFQADQFNIQQSNRQELTDNEINLNYEARALAGLNNTRDDLRGYYNRLQQNNLGNFRYINNLNSLNAMYDDFQTDGMNYYNTSRELNLQNPLTPAGGRPITVEEAQKIVDEAKKAKKKKKS